MTVTPTTTQKPHVPELRFPGFRGDWEEKRLGEVARIYDGTHQTPKYVKQGVPFYSVEHVTANDFSKTKFISEEVFSKENKRVILEKNDILMTRIGDIGTSRLIDWGVRASFYVSLALIKVDHEEVDSRFMNQTIKTDYFQKELWKRTIHVAFPKKINLGEIGNCTFKGPSLPEQQKIADFLTAVDKWIENLTEQKQRLVDYKRGMMQQLFPQKGETNPRLRFRDEDGNAFPDWEEKRLGEMCKITTGKLDANAMKDDGRYRFYTCAKEYYHIDKYAFDTEALLISGNGANVGYIHYFQGKFNAYQRTYVLDGFIENIKYVMFFLNKTLKKRISSEKKDGNTPYIVLGTLKDMQINIPDVDEQQKIADFLTQVDTLIESKQTQITQAKEWKRGLVGRMFV